MSVPGVVGPADFVLRVKGESMVDAGLLDGDYVVVRRQQDASNGDIVVALVGRTTLRMKQRSSGSSATTAACGSSPRTLRWSRSTPTTSSSSVASSGCTARSSAMGEIAALNRTLEQELFALLRGASLECLVCGEFVLHRADGSIGCSECGLVVAAESASAREVRFDTQAG